MKYLCALRVNVQMTFTRKALDGNNHIKPALQTNAGLGCYSTEEPPSIRNKIFTTIP